MVTHYRNSVCIIARKEDKFLLVRNKEWGKDLWKFPQGGINKGESISNAAKREFYEELGSRKITINHISKENHIYGWSEEFRKFKKTNYIGQTLSFVIAEVNENKLKCNKKEIEKYKWVDADEIFNLKYKDYADKIISILTLSEVKRFSDLLFPRNLKKSGQFFKKLNFNLTGISRHHNSLNGILKKGSKKYFFKVGSSNEVNQEIGGYLLLVGKYPVPKLKHVFILGPQTVFIFEYEKTIKKDKGTLCDYLNEKNILELSVLKRIFKFYKNNLKTVSKRSTFPIDEFFKNRIKTRLIPWYSRSKSPILNYEFIINGNNHGSLLKIIDKTIKYFNKDKRLTCFLSQGDPTPRNICIKPLFFDFKTSGYNPIVGEISTFYWSIVLGSYLNPKYNPEPYLQNHPNVVKKFSEYKPEIKYKINNKNGTIDVEFSFSKNKNSRRILKEYLELFRSGRFMHETNNDLRYFLIVRTLGRFDVLKMEEEDSIISGCVACLLFKSNVNYLNYVLSLL